MTSEQIELNRLVYEKYPKQEIEKTCWQERIRLQHLREAYKVRLISEREKDISGTVHKQDELL